MLFRVLCLAVFSQALKHSGEDGGGMNNGFFYSFKEKADRSSHDLSENAAFPVDHAIDR